jgi:hypothetical protein
MHGDRSAAGPAPIRRELTEGPSRALRDGGRVVVPRSPMHGSGHAPFRLPFH